MSHVRLFGLLLSALGSDRHPSLFEDFAVWQANKMSWTHPVLALESDIFPGTQFLSVITKCSEFKVLSNF